MLTERPGRDPALTALLRNGMTRCPLGRWAPGQGRERRCLCARAAARGTFSPRLSPAHLHPAASPSLVMLLMLMQGPSLNRLTPTSDTFMRPSKSRSITSRSGACNAARVRSLVRARSAIAASRMAWGGRGNRWIGAARPHVAAARGGPANNSSMQEPWVSRKQCTSFSRTR
jgi:hypothetical protein